MSIRLGAKQVIVSQSKNSRSIKMREPRFGRLNEHPSIQLKYQLTLK